MYSHEVIREMEKNDKQQVIGVKTRQIIAQKIRETQKFHMGGIETLQKMFNTDSPVFMDPVIKSPYDNCWFDCFTPEIDKPTIYNSVDFNITLDKLGVLLQRHSNVYEIFAFNHIKQTNKWDLSVIKAVVKDCQEYSLDEKIINLTQWLEKADVDADFAIEHLPDFPKHLGSFFKNVEFLPIIDPQLFKPLILNNPVGAVVGRIKSDRDYMEMVIKTVYTFIEILNCSNISTQLITPTKTVIKKKKKRKVQIPRREYHILEVLVPRETTQPSSSQETGRRMKFHYVRGYMKTLRKNRVVPERIWVQSYSRGDISLGIVEKDYKAKYAEVS